MPRVKIEKDQQIKFFKDILEKSGTDWLGLAGILRIHPRSLSDWKKGKYTIPKKVFDRCVKLIGKGLKIPSYKIFPDFWSIEKASKKGGLITARRHGGPGTLEGRKKGGLVSQERRKQHPELYKNCVIRKNILRPRNNSRLAEFFGIMLGDGGINSDYQAVISLHKENDKKYSRFIGNLIKKLFGIKCAIYRYNSPKCQKVIGVVISSVSLVEFLLGKGLKKGNKVRQQVGIPDWIKKRSEFSKSCLRGIIDTDGDVYFHKHKTNDFSCLNIGLQVSSQSVPITNFCFETLKHFGFNPKRDKSSIILYREKEVYRYAREIGFSNFHHNQRLKKFFKTKHRRSAPNW
jgi:hypothetical protein